MVDKSDIRENLIKIFKEVSLAEEEEFIDNQPLEDVLDSLSFIEIYNEIDDQYALEVELEEVIRLKNFDEVVDLVFTKLSEGSTG